MKICVLIILFLSTQNIYSQEISWEYMSGPEIGTVRDIQEVNGIIYINTENGVFRSSDHGESWHHLHGYGNQQVFAVSFQNTLFARFVNWDDGTQKCTQEYSTNGGLEWKEFQFPLPDNPCWLSYAGFDSSGTLYLLRLGLEDSIIVYSTDDLGNSWKYSISEFDKKDFVHWREEILHNGNIIIGGYYRKDDDYPGQIYIGKDLGKEWELLEGLPGVRCWGFLSDDEIYAGTGDGLFYTSDRGKNWDKLHSADLVLDVLSINTNELLMSTNEGLFYSPDKGKNWDHFYDEFFLTLYKSENGDIFGGNFLGFHISTDQGRTWRRSNKGFSAANIMDFTFDKKGNVYVCDRGVYKSSDDGETWHLLGLGGKDIRNLLVSEEGYIYAPGGSGEGMFRSTDDGKNWEEFEGGNGGSDIIETRRGDILLGSSYHAITRSTDKGQTWQSENIGFDPNCYAYNNQGELFAGFSRGLFYRSTDDGYTWEQSSEETKDYDYRDDIYQLVFSNKHPVGFANCYAPKYFNYSSGATFRTTDNGKSWHQFKFSDLLAFDSVGNLWSRFRRSTDFGETWELFIDGLNHTGYISFAVSPKGYIFAGAYRGGIYRTKNPIVSVEENDLINNNDITISPNPATDILTVSYSTSEPGTVLISLLDILGRKAIVLPEKYTDSGIHKELIDISSLNSGIYFISVRIGSGIITRKVVVSRY